MRSVRDLEVPWGGWNGARTAASAFGWRRMLVSIAVLGVSGYAGLQAYEHWGPAEAAPPAAAQTSVATQRSIVERASLPGTVGAARQARLAFSSSSSGASVSGRVESISVRTGDTVAAGQELARLNTASLELAVQSARSALTVAQLKMQQLLAGALPADAASAVQSVISAQSALQKAENDLLTLVGGPEASELAGADQSVISSNAALQKAQNDLATLQAGATSADLATATKAALDAQNALVTAQAALDALQGRSAMGDQLTAAQKDAEAASAERNSARAAFEAALSSLPAETATSVRAAADELHSAVATVCNSIANREQCGKVAQSATDLGGLVFALDGGLTGGASAITQAYAQFDKSGPSTTVASLRQPLLSRVHGAATLPSLNARIQSLLIAVGGSGGIPTSDALANAQRTRDGANAALSAAQAKLDTLTGGPDSTALQAARNAVESAQAGLTTATAKRDQVRAGATSSALQGGQNSVDTARAALQTAVARRDQVLGGPLPVDIAVQQQALQQAEVNLRKAEDDLAGARLSAPFAGVVGAITMNVGENSGTGAIVLIDPSTMQLNASAQESEVGRLKVGQSVNLTFDAYQGTVLPGRVASVAPAAEVVQGVPSYAVVIEVMRSQSARGGATVDLRGGMAGTAAIELVRHDNVLAVPSRAVRRQGREQLVEVMVDGKTEMRTVRAGATDGQFTEILEGLNEGDVVTIPSTTTTTTTGTQQQQAPQGRQEFFIAPGKVQ